MSRSTPQPEIVTRATTVATPWVIGADGILSREVAGVEVDQDVPDQATTTAIAVGPSAADYSLPMAYRRLLTSLERARHVVETIKVRDAAVALHALAKMARNTAAERAVAEIRVRAERKVGELCRELTRLQGTRGKTNLTSAIGPGHPFGNKERADGRRTKASQLAAAGITIQQSKIWEKLAAISSPVFEAALANAPSLSTRAILRAAWSPSRTTATTEVDQVALRLWRQLVAMDDGMLDRDPRLLLKALTPAMRGTVYALAPRIAAWLDRLPPAPNSRKARTAAIGDQVGPST